MAVAALPESVDPLTPGGPQNTIAGVMGSRLISFDVQGLEGQGCNELATVDEIKGELAESWEFSADRLTLTLSLRQGVLSPFGNEMTAQDAKWSLDRARELNSVSQFLTSQVSLWQETDAVEIVDDYTIAIHLADARTMDAAIFTIPRLIIHDSTEALAHATAEDPWANAFLQLNTANFGPWHATEEDFEPGQQLTFHRNPNYYAPEELGNIGRLIMRAIPESSVRAQLVSTGEVDYAAVLAPADYQQIEATGRAQILTCVSPDRDILVLNEADERFADVRVRQAISLAIDREVVAQTAYYGFAQAATDGLHQGYDFPRPSETQRVQHDPERARQLLAEAGYPDGFDADLLINLSRFGPQAEQEAVSVVSQLQAIGINFRINIVAAGPDFQAAWAEGTYEAILSREPPALADPAYAAGLYALCDVFENNFGYCNERYDELQRLIQITPLADPGRTDYVTELSGLIVDTVPIVYLVDVNIPQAFSQAVDVSAYEGHVFWSVQQLHKLSKNSN